MRRLYGLCASFLLLFLAGCATAPSVITDYHGAYDFSQLETFEVIESEQGNKDNILISPFTFTHLQQVVVDQLSQRYQPVAEGQQSDFEVRYHIVVEERLDVRSYDRRYGFGFYHFGYHYHHQIAPPPSPRVYSQGSLIIDIIDSSTKEPIWRGVAEERLYDRINPERQREILSSAARDILSRFPPVAGSDR